MGHSIARTRLYARGGALLRPPYGNADRWPIKTLPVKPGTGRKNP